MIDTILKHWRAVIFLIGFVPTVASPIGELTKYSVIGVYSLAIYGQFLYSENRKEKEKAIETERLEKSKQIELDKEETVRQEELKKREEKIATLEKELADSREKLTESKEINGLYHKSYTRYRTFVLVEYFSEHEALKAFTESFKVNHGRKSQLTKEIEFLEQLLVSKSYLYVKEKEEIDNVERDVPRRGDFR